MHSNKTMFEIYREEGYGQKYRVVYFTELNDQSREVEITRAMAGTHLHDGFIKDYEKEKAKGIIDRFVERLNAGEAPQVDELLKELEPYTP